jgi:iron transport multicopper oxidase
LPSNDDVKFNGNLSIPFEAGKTYRIRVLKFVSSVFQTCARAHFVSASDSTGIFATTFFWIDGHDMRVIEADGVSFRSSFEKHSIRRFTADSASLSYGQVDTEEYPVDYLNIAVAQRYSVLVTARNDTSQNFLVHANFDDGMFDTVPDGLALSSSHFLYASRVHS